MPIYEFECPKCKKHTEIFLTFNDIRVDRNVTLGNCKSKKCGQFLCLENQLINFSGGINMNSSSVGVAQRKYSNKAGGPKPIIDGKIRKDLKMPVQG